MEQKEMMESAHAKIVRRLSIFNEIMSGPNPLTQDEIRALLAKRPAEYSFMKAWIK